MSTEKTPEKAAIADEIFNKMRATNEKETKTKVEKRAPKETYTSLMINKTKRGRLILGSTVFFFLTYSILARHLVTPEAVWQVVALPIVGMGVLLALLPATEDWVYRPWQSRARQYEKHQIDRRSYR